MVAGLALSCRPRHSAASVVALTRLPVDGNYAWDLLPAFVVGGAGMALSFVPVTIAGLSGVSPTDAGIASGLINTSRQIGGAIGVAAISAVAATSTGNYLDAHPALATTSPVAIDHGLRTGLYVLSALLILGALISVALVRPAPASEARAERVDTDVVVLEEAA